MSSIVHSTMRSIIEKLSRDHIVRRSVPAVHPEVAARRDRRCPHLRRVVRLACRLGEGVEAGPDQHLLQPVVENMPRRARNLPPRHHQLALPFPLPSQRHPENPAQSVT